MSVYVRACIFMQLRCDMKAYLAMLCLGIDRVGVFRRCGTCFLGMVWHCKNLSELETEYTDNAEPGQRQQRLCSDLCRTLSSIDNYPCHVLL